MMKNKLIGCFEILLFMHKGIERFGTASRTDVLRSFLIPVLLLPVMLVILVLKTPQMEVSMPFFIMVHAARNVVGTIIYVGILYASAKIMEKREYFPLCLVVGNWFSLLQALMAVPVLGYILLGGVEQDIESYAVFITLLGYVYTGYILTRCLRIPWEMGGLLAIIGMAVGDVLWDVTTYTLAHYSLPT